MDADLLRYLEGMEKRQREHIDERTQGLENRLREYIDERIQAQREHIDERVQALREYIDERTHDSETRIVRAFGAYQESSSVRMRKIEADVSNINSSTT
jgi:chaperonin cofactor prefoldin